MAILTVKGQRASNHQAQNIILLVKLGKQMGANKSQLAGALATMMQESSCINLKGGDRDSMGLYQQRPSCSWGSPAQVTNPNYSIPRFLRPYLTYCRQGYEPIRASHKVQASAYAEAPRQWYNESWKDIGIITGGKDVKDVTISGVTLPTGGSGGTGAAGDSGADYGTDITITRDLPYEFTRGSPDNRENSWDASGRLADEVKWRRWMRAGALWFASEDYLKSQPVRFTFAQGVRGCIKIDWSADTRRAAADCTVTALARRWSVLPGDVVRIANEGPADGLWLVKSTRRSIDDSTTEIVLMRNTRKTAEPAPQQTTNTIHVASVTAGAADKPPTKGKSGLSVPSLTISGYNAPNAPSIAAKAYAAAEALSRQNLPYVYGGAHGPGAILREHPPPTDCSSGVSWVLIRAGVRIPGSQSQACVSGDYTRWGLPGRGKYMTVMCNATHVWIRWYGLGAWRFDTSGYGDGYRGSSGGRNRSTPRPEGSFVHRHWPNT